MSPLQVSVSVSASVAGHKKHSLKVGNTTFLYGHNVFYIYTTEEREIDESGGELSINMATNQPTDRSLM